MAGTQEWARFEAAIDELAASMVERFDRLEVAGQRSVEAAQRYPVREVEPAATDLA